MLLKGDFNLHKVFLHLIMLASILTVLPLIVLIHYLISILKMVFYNSIKSNKNHVGCQLDLVFSNSINTFVFLSTEELVPVDVYHPVLSIICEYTILSTWTHNCSFTYNFKGAVYRLITLALSNYDWSKLYDSHCIKFATNEFYCIVLVFINFRVLKYIKRKQKYLNWF